jgi:hypothetical protein
LASLSRPVAASNNTISGHMPLSLQLKPLFDNVKTGQDAGLDAALTARPRTAAPSPVRHTTFTLGHAQLPEKASVRQHGSGHAPAYAATPRPQPASPAAYPAANGLLASEQTGGARPASAAISESRINELQAQVRWTSRCCRYMLVVRTCAGQVVFTVLGLHQAAMHSCMSVVLLRPAFRATSLRSSTCRR